MRAQKVLISAMSIVLTLCLFIQLCNSWVFGYHFFTGNPLMFQNMILWLCSCLEVGLEYHQLLGLDLGVGRGRVLGRLLFACSS